jgi:hypothetical protein
MEKQKTAQKNREKDPLSSFFPYLNLKKFSHKL